MVWKLKSGNRQKLVMGTRIKEKNDEMRKWEAYKKEMENILD